MGKVSRIPTIGDYTIFFNSLFFVLYSEIDVTPGDLAHAGALDSIHISFVLGCKSSKEADSNPCMNS